MESTWNLWIDVNEGPGKQQAKGNEWMIDNMSRKLSSVDFEGYYNVVQYSIWLQTLFFGSFSFYIPIDEGLSHWLTGLY